MKQLSPEFPGHEEAYEHYSVFVPGDFFRSHEIDFSQELLRKAEQALLHFDRLSQALENLPDREVFIQAFKEKEAVFSNRIEGTRANLKDLLSARVAPSNPNQEDDLAEITASLRAIDLGLELIKDLPLNAALLRRIHAKMLDQPRGQRLQPGKFRDGAVYIGAGGGIANAVYVPPPATLVPTAMDNLDRFMRDGKLFLPALIKAGLIHYQFESIHPFWDGNGRMGRLLIALHLQENGFSNHSALYLSHYIFQHRPQYYHRLNQARLSHGEMANWVDYFLTGALVSAKHGLATINRAIELKADLIDHIKHSGAYQVPQQLEFLDYLYRNPIVSVQSVQQDREIDRPSATRIIKRFVGWEILVDEARGKKDGIYVFQPYLNLLEEDLPVLD